MANSLKEIKRTVISSLLSRHIRRFAACHKFCYAECHKVVKREKTNQIPVGTAPTKEGCEAGLPCPLIKL